MLSPRLPTRDACDLHRKELKSRADINMKQMNMVDAFFLYSDQPRTAQNVTIIWVYDRSTARGNPVTIEEVRDHIASRAHLISAFRKRVVHVPGDIDFPWWVDDPNFAPENHIHHNTLPPPGDWQQLRELAAKIHARCVDLSRPLWDIHVVDGVDNVDGVPSGAFALVMKCQHAAMDGPTSVKANETINSTNRRRRQLAGPGILRSRAATCAMGAVFTRDPAWHFTTSKVGMGAWETGPNLCGQDYCGQDSGYRFAGFEAARCTSYALQWTGQFASCIGRLFLGSGHCQGTAPRDGRGNTQ